MKDLFFTSWSSGTFVFFACSSLMNGACSLLMVVAQLSCGLNIGPLSCQLSHLVWQVRRSRLLTSIRKGVVSGHFTRHRWIEHFRSLIQTNDRHYRSPVQLPVFKKKKKKKKTGWGLQWLWAQDCHLVVKLNKLNTSLWCWWSLPLPPGC